MKKTNIAIYCILIICMLSNLLLSQDTNANTNNVDTQTNSQKELIAPAKSTAPITGFGEIALGSDMESTIANLIKNPLISLDRKYKESDIYSEVSDSFISINQNKFFRSGYFLFQDNSLYSITIRYQEKQVGFLDLLNTLNNKYGKGSFLDANTVAWEYDNKQLILERPTTLKYIATDIANDVRVNYTNTIVTNALDVLEGI